MPCSKEESYFLTMTNYRQTIRTTVPGYGCCNTSDPPWSIATGKCVVDRLLAHSLARKWWNNQATEQELISPLSSAIYRPLLSVRKERDSQPTVTTQLPDYPFFKATVMVI